MSCLLPPVCAFCLHFNTEIDNETHGECRAFAEIPETIIRGECDHHEPLANDQGLQFLLNPALAVEFAEVNELRELMDLPKYRMHYAKTALAAL